MFRKNPSKFATKDDVQSPSGNSKFITKENSIQKQPKKLKQTKRKVKSISILNGVSVDFNDSFPTDGDLDYMEVMIKDIIYNNCPCLIVNNVINNQLLDYIDRIIYETSLELSNPQGYSL